MLVLKGVGLEEGVADPVRHLNQTFITLKMQSCLFFMMLLSCLGFFVLFFFCLFVCEVFFNINTLHIVRTSVK